MKKIFYFILIIFIAATYLQAETKESVYNHFKKKFENLSNVKLVFQSIENKSDSGELIATSQNEFRIITKDRIISCDGKSIYNHSVSQKQVVISEADQTLSNPIYNTFFKIINNSKPINLKQTSNSKKGSNFILTVVSNEDKSEIIDIYFDKNKVIYQIGFKMKNISGNYKISKLQINQKLSPTIFKFKETDKLEVIDLR